MTRYRFGWFAGVLMGAGLLSGGVAHAQESTLAGLRETARDHPIALARALRRAGHFDEAVRVLSTVPPGTPIRALALWEVARVRFDQVNFRGAQLACRALPMGRNVHDPAGLTYHVCLARAHIVWHRVALADAEIQIAQRLNPNDPELLLVSADSKRLASDVPAAETLYRSAAQAMPDRADPYVGLGTLYEVSRRLDDAEAAYRKGVEVDAQDPQANLALGRFLLTARGDHATALPLLQKASTERPSWAEALVALGEAQLANGDHAGALVSFTETIRLEPATAGANRGLGRARIAAGQWTEAEAALKVAIEQVPNDAEAHAALAEVYAHNNRGQDALDSWNRVIDLSPGDMTPRMRAANLAHELGQNSLARAYILRILGDQPQHAPALLLQADIAYEENDRASARTFYQQAIDGTGDIDRTRARARITEIDAPRNPNRRH